MDSVHAPELPTAGRAIDLEGWALHVARAHAGRSGNADLTGADRSGSGGAGARDAMHAPRTTTDAGRLATRESRVILSRPRMDLVARVLWSTASAASVLEVDRSTAARDWFDDLALGRVVLPAHALVLPESAGTWRGASSSGASASAAASNGATSNGAASNGARPTDLVRVDAASFAAALADRDGRRSDGFVVRERARWMHPALRSAAEGVDRAPFVHGWINLAAFVEPTRRSAFADTGRFGSNDRFASGGANSGAATGAVDWVGLRAAVRRCVRLFDGLLEVHAGRAADRASDRENGRGTGRENGCEAELDTDLEWRRIGIGVAGLGAALARLGVDPGSTAAQQSAQRLALCVTENAHRMSVELGQARGVFPRFADTVWADGELTRRHGLLTCSWASDGLLAASGLGEGVVDAPNGEHGDHAVHAPALLDQVRVQVAVQRAFEGVALIELAVGRNHDAGVFHRIASDSDVQAVRCADPSAVRRDDERTRAGGGASRLGGSSMHGSSTHTSSGFDPAAFGARETRFDANAPTRDHDELRPVPRTQVGESTAADRLDSGERPRFRAPQTLEADGYTIAPALRLDVRTERGPWRLDVVYDEHGERELELVLVSGPPGPDGWRLVDGVNAALRDGARSLTAALDRAAAATPGAADLVTVLRRFAERDRVEA